MVRDLTRFRDIRTERLRALGILGARRTFAHSKEAARRARLAYERLRAEPGYRSAARRRFHERCTSRTPAYWWALAGSIAVIAFLVGQGSLLMMTAVLAVVVLKSLLVVFSIQQRTLAIRKDENDVAREFEAFFASRASRLSGSLRQDLRRLGEDLSTLLLETAGNGERSPLSVDELRFMRVIVVEHLVNAVDPYLALRQPNACHEDLVVPQIERIHREVRALLAKLEATRVQQLARSARFLERKLGS